MTKKVADSKRWMLLGIEVSGKCLATLLGLGLDRLQRQTRGAVDRRFKAIWLQCVFAFLAYCSNEHNDVNFDHLRLSRHSRADLSRGGKLTCTF